MLALLVEAREALEESAREAHESANGGKWHHPAGTRYVECAFEDCGDNGCEDARDLIARLPEGGQTND